MFKGKTLLMLVIVIAIGMLIGACGGDKTKPANEPAPAPSQQEIPKEEPKVEEPKVEEPKKEEVKAEASKPEPKQETPKASALSIPHALDGMYATCGTCHAGGALLKSKPSHSLDGAYANCAACHQMTTK